MRVLFEIDNWKIVKGYPYPYDSAYIKHNVCDSYTASFKHTVDDLYAKLRCTYCWKVVPKGIQALLILYTCDNV